MSTLISIPRRTYDDVNEPALLPGSLYRIVVNEHHYNATATSRTSFRETRVCVTTHA